MIATIGPAVGAVGSWVAWRERHRLGQWGAGWTRVNHRGCTVSLFEGPALLIGLSVGVTASPVPGWVKLGTITAVVGSGVLGIVDDLAASGTEKGLRGHLAAARDGRLTTGMLKVAGIGASSLIASAVIAHDRPLLVQAAGGAVIAAGANLMNLFDLRPGRALKVSLLTSTAVSFRGRDSATLALTTAGVAASMLSLDLREAAMMGDAGANALGACVAVAYLVSNPSRAQLGTVLSCLVALTLVSEKVSFTRVIESTPYLRDFDAWGRRR